MKVNAESISESFEKNRQEMLRLDETSFLSTGALITQQPDKENDIFAFPEKVRVSGRRSKLKGGIHFHPFEDKFIVLDTHDITAEDIHELSLYKPSASVEKDVKRGLGFESGVKQNNFHPFGKKFEINEEKSWKRVF